LSKHSAGRTPTHTQLRTVMDTEAGGGLRAENLQRHARGTRLRWASLFACGLLVAVTGCVRRGGTQLPPTSATLATPATPATPTPTYSLGGTINGLTSPGLVLTNGGSTVSVPDDTTSFQMPTALNAGAGYAVTVNTQPAGQTCTVADGSGTVGTANISNVVVTCSNQAYILGGTISGLMSAGLVLANGIETLSVAADASSFSFPGGVAYGSSFAITVHTQPAGQACSVSSGTGTMAAHDVTTVTVTCAGQEFALGGTISGLGHRTGLVLANGNDTLSVSANATAFTMPAQIVFGSTYAVTVQSAPVGQTCSVSNGTGVMAAHAVTNVAIACSGQAYTVGGSISGLTSSGLVLANGGDVLSVAADATDFNMPTTVPYASAYAVKVQTQPIGLTCTVSNGSGTMPARPVSDVGIACAASTYTLGGSIAGLAVDGLVLTDGIDRLDVAAHAASFTMTTGLASGSNYAVTVADQPGGEVCQIVNGSGTVGSTDVASVQVTCGSNMRSFATSGTFTWNVPPNVYLIEVIVAGGGGGGSGGGGGGDEGGVGGGPGGAGAGSDALSGVGGNGGVVSAYLAVSAGETLTIAVGGGGGGDSNGGGGGGSSNVSVDGALQIIAGGGGGGGVTGNGGDGAGSGSTGADGGNGTDASGNSAGGNGGGGGVGGTNAFDSSPGGNGSGGPGGMGSAPGGYGVGDGFGGGGGGSGSGGGGGGGYGGGAGGGGYPTLIGGGGGGGGSTGPAGSVFSDATNGGAMASAGSDGSVVITYP